MQQLGTKRIGNLDEGKTVDAIETCYDHSRLASNFPQQIRDYKGKKTRVWRGKIEKKKNAGDMGGEKRNISKPKLGVKRGGSGETGR